MRTILKSRLQLSALFSAILLTGTVGTLPSSDAASSSGKKAKSNHSSVGSYSSAPRPRVYRRGTSYNFTNWDRDTTHEGYGEYYDGRFQFFGHTPTVGYSRRRY